MLGQHISDKKASLSRSFSICLCMGGKAKGRQTGMALLSSPSLFSNISSMGCANLAKGEGNRVSTFSILGLFLPSNRGPCEVEPALERPSQLSIYAFGNSLCWLIICHFRAASFIRAVLPSFDFDFCKCTEKRKNRGQ